MAASFARPGAFFPAHTDFPTCLAVAAHSTVPVPQPTKMTSQRRTDTGRRLATKRLCTVEKLSRTSLKVSAIESRASHKTANVEGKHPIEESAPELLVTDYMSRFRSRLDSRRFLSMTVLCNRPLATVRRSRPDTRLGAWTRLVASRPLHTWQWICISVNVGSPMAVRSLVKCEPELPFIRTLRKVLKQASAEKSFENIL